MLIHKLITLILLALLLPNYIFAVDECSPADFSATLDSSNTTYSKSGSANGQGDNDTFYIDVSSAGDVTVEVSGNKILFSYAESSCPAQGDAPNATTATYSFAIATDFNLRVYRTSGNANKDYTLTITFVPRNDPPIANDDTATTNQDTAVDIDVTANDTDSDGTIDATTVTIVQAASNGTTSINATTGVVTYTPNAGYSGTDTFTYTVNDNDGATSNVATVSITINAVIACAKTIYVDDNGDDTDPTQCSTAYTTVQKALDHIVDDCTGDTFTIKICDGIYNESKMELKNSKFKALTIESESENRDSVIIKTSKETFNIDGKDHDMTGISIKNLSIESADKDSIKVKDVDSVTLINLKLTTKNKAIKLENSDNSSISYITINTSDKEGMEIKKSEPTLEYLCITSKNEAIKLSATSGITLTNSSFTTTSKANIKYDKTTGANSISNSCFMNKTYIEYKDAGDSFNHDGNYWAEGDAEGGNELASCPISDCGYQETVIPIADYRFDECSWNGTADEVEDNSSNNFHATAHNGANTADVHQIERSGYFDGTDDYIEQNNIYNTLRTTASLSFWIKTTQVGNNTTWQAPGVTGIEQSGGGNDIFWGWFDASGHIGISAKGDSTTVKSTNPINDDSWHHIVLTRNHNSGMVQIYVDGTLEDSDIHPSGIIGNSFNRIGSIQDTGGTPTYFQGYLDEVKVYDGVVTDTQVTEIYNNESSGNNYDGTARVSTNCTVIEDPIHYFDAWGTFRDINDRNISTKISEQNFQLTLASLNETNDDYREFNGTVCTQAVDMDHAQTAKSSWVKSLFSDTNTSTVSFTITPAVKNSRINIVWKRNVDEACPLNNEDNSTLSSDNFAIRPDHFSIATTGPYYAGELFTIVANAYNINTIATTDYNETQAGSSFTIDANETRPECITSTETFTIGNADFTHGVTPSIDANFTGIATYLNIEIHENNGSEFALVDSDDTSDILRHITPHDVNITVSPYELNVTLTEINASTDTDWIYMADISDMNMSLHVKVQANNKQHNVLQDFNASCYAQDVTILLGTTTDGVDTTDMNYSATLGTFSDGSTLKNETLADINQTMTIPAANFSVGVGDTTMTLNVNRKFYTPINPFKIGGLSATITNSGIAKDLNHNTDLDDGNISLFYGRLRPSDIKTSQDPVTTQAEIEVYDTTTSDYVKTFRQNSLHWYRHENHNSKEEGHIKAIDRDFNITSNIQDPISGTVEIRNIAKHVGRHTLHVDVDPWLWYVPKDFGEAYDYSDDCMHHPCFNYTFIEGTTGNTIKSGNFSGSDFSEKDRGDYVKKGIKVFR